MLIQINWVNNGLSDILVDKSMPDTAQSDISPIHLAVVGEIDWSTCDLKPDAGFGTAYSKYPTTLAKAKLSCCLTSPHLHPFADDWNSNFLANFTKIADLITGSEGSSPSGLTREILGKGKGLRLTWPLIIVCSIVCQCRVSHHIPTAEKGIFGAR
jgi:hypothetical protein